MSLIGLASLHRYVFPQLTHDSPTPPLAYELKRGAESQMFLQVGQSRCGFASLCASSALSFPPHLLLLLVLYVFVPLCRSPHAHTMQTAVATRRSRGDGFAAPLALCNPDILRVFVEFSHSLALSFFDFVVCFIFFLPSLVGWFVLAALVMEVPPPPSPLFLHPSPSLTFKSHLRARHVEVKAGRLEERGSDALRRAGTVQGNQREGGREAIHLTDSRMKRVVHTNPTH